MPLLIITGNPASGKSTITDRIREFFNTKGATNIEVISDDRSGSFSRSLYEVPRNERQHREFIRSEVQRSLTKDCIVICDSLNYVKGFRYELFCIAKLVKTTYAVVFCNADEETCLWLNAQKEPLEKYNEDVIRGLRMRYEPPEGKNRWDSPLFELKVGTSEKPAGDGEVPLTEDLKYPAPRALNLPLDDVYSCLIEGKELPVNLSTLNTPLVTHDFIQTLEQVTKEVTTSIFQQQTGAVVGDAFIVPYCSATDEKAVFKRQRSLPELSRLRRQFITYAKKHPVQEKSKIASLFVNFLNSNL